MHGVNPKPLQYFQFTNDKKILKFKTYSVCRWIPLKASSSIESSIEYSINLRNDQEITNNASFIILKLNHSLLTNILVFLRDEIHDL